MYESSGRSLAKYRAGLCIRDKVKFKKMTLDQISPLIELYPLLTSSANVHRGLLPQWHKACYNRRDCLSDQSEVQPQYYPWRPGRHNCLFQSYATCRLKSYLCWVILKDHPRRTLLCKQEINHPTVFSHLSPTVLNHNKYLRSIMEVLNRIRPFNDNAPDAYHQRIDCSNA